MRSFFTFLLVCLCLSVATAQSTTKKKSTTTKKTATTAKKTTTVKKPVATKPRPVTVAAAATEPAPSTLTFPSTEPENAATLDAAKKQQMYDELHGVKSQTNTPDTGKKGRKTERTRDSDEMATRANRKAAVASSDEARTYIGVRVGGNYNTYLEKLQTPNGSGGFINLTPDPSYGFQAGVVFQFGRGGIAFQPEINFQQDYIKVTTFTSPTSLTGVTTTQSVSSLVVPLLAKFQFGEQGSTRFFANVGPYGQYSLEARPANSETVIGYGGALGLGIGIPTSSGKFTIEARGYYPLGSTASGSEFGKVLGKPITAQLAVAYLFPLGSR
ncbi:porin family protein [uncultured Fibrella sp.]|uniref:porin family protein n=1 Tax=uncultured Fibrella sp. TaxID=1284596 RepID=UPI0035CBA47B